MNTAARRITESRLIAVIRATSAQEARNVGRALIDEGVDVLEFSLTTPDALSLINEFASTTEACVGAGTVITVEQASEVRAAGAAFLVSPNANHEVIAMSANLGIPIAAGVYTASECALALQAGAQFLKLFPASIGGVALMKALSAPFPGVAWVPTGGVDTTNVMDWWKAGAVAVGVGGSLTGAGVAAARATARELRALARSVPVRG